VVDFVDALADSLRLTRGPQILYEYRYLSVHHRFHDSMILLQVRCEILLNIAGGMAIFINIFIVQFFSSGGVFSNTIGHHLTHVSPPLDALQVLNTTRPNLKIRSNIFHKSYVLPQNRGTRRADYTVDDASPPNPLLLLILWPHSSVSNLSLLNQGPPFDPVFCNRTIQ
ncbi:hypothetical protein C0J52_25207, partial [Blattella germanica]